MAARGARENAEGGVTAIDDPEAVQQLQNQASRVYFEAIAIAVVAIAVVMLARGLLGSYVPSTFYGPD